MPAKSHTPTSFAMDAALDDVRTCMFDLLKDTPMQVLLGDFSSFLGSGKMLRSRLAFRVGPAAGVDYQDLVYTAAAVEMIHAASLLHDDVIDGGTLRRGRPAFWVERGVSGTILLGDLLLVKSIELSMKTSVPGLAETFLRLICDVCYSEIEQELQLRGKESTWNDVLSIARNKTGALFAFPAYACGGDDAELRTALKESGFKAGTAYQIADDVLDVIGQPEDTGKTLGTDKERDKTTALAHLVRDGEDPVASVSGLLAEADALLEPWPEVQAAWNNYVAEDLDPVIRKILSGLSR